MQRILAVCFVLVALAGADTLSVSLGQIACIQNREQYGRLLVQFDLSAIPESSFVYYAEILAPCEIADTIAVEARRVTRDWGRSNVRWDYPWRRPGGDFDTTATALHVFVPGRHRNLALNITRYVRHWIDNGHTGSYGLLFRKGMTREPGFVKIQRMSGVLSRARVRVIYRRPRRRGDFTLKGKDQD